MQIELIGCTCAGKSSLSQQLVKTYGSQLITSYDFVVQWAGFGWVRPHKARMAILNVLALLACLVTLRSNLPFYRYMADIIRRLPPTVRFAEKLKIARIAARNVGIYEISRRQADQIILADEGTLHIANYLFVHVMQEPNLEELQAFLRRVALPDVVVYLQQPENVLVSRTIRKGHKRIPDGAPELVSSFIRHSQAVFENLTESPRVKDRLLVLCNGEVTTPDMDSREKPQLAFARQILES